MWKSGQKDCKGKGSPGRTGQSIILWIQPESCAHELADAVAATQGKAINILVSTGGCVHARVLAPSCAQLMVAGEEELAMF